MLQNLTSNITRPSGKGSAASISEECYKELKEAIDAVDERVDALSDNVVTECIQADRGNITTLSSNSIETDNVVTDGLSTNSAIVTNATIDHLTNKDISTECVTTNTVTTDAITADTANIDTASINHLSLTSATIPALSATNVTSNCLNTCNATADSLTANNVTSNTVCSDTANITSLNSNTISANTVTAPITNATQVNAQNVAATNKVEAVSIEAVNAVIQDIESNGIKASGTINLDPELPSTNDYYQLFIPEFDNFYATFYGKSNNRKLAISVIGTKKTAIVQASQDILGLITDVEFKRNAGIYIKFKADEQLHYHIIYNSENFNKDSIAVTLNGTNTAEYSYAVDKAAFYLFRGYNSNDISAILPVNANIHAIEADEQHYQESTTEVLKVYDKLYVVDTVDSSGTAITLSSGEDNQYLSIFDTGAVDSDGCAILHPTYKTPVDTTTGCLSNSQCLITERAVSTWNGTANGCYPISHLNETTCAHGDLNIACGVTSDSLSTNTAAICNAIIDTATITDSTICNATVSCATITEETVTSSDIDTATITDATITDATVENAAIDELSANTLNVACDVKIAGDLYVDGTTHTVNQEDIEVEGDTLALRVNNPTSLTAGQVSGIMINKYNGTDNLTMAADCTGTARVGTGTGTDTSYTNIAYDDVTHKWYDYDGTAYTEMATQPTGTITSYTDKVVDAPYTRYATITFTSIDVTSLEPILTRAEEADMEDGYLTKWDATNKRAVTCGTSHTHNLFVMGCMNACCSITSPYAGITNLIVSCDATVNRCLTVLCDTRTFGDATVDGNLTTENAFIFCNTTIMGTTCACNDVTISCNLTVKEDIINCGSTEICGDLTVHGDITIGGDISLDKIGTVTNTDNCDQYLTFVADNNTAMASEQVRTDADITYNPYTDTMTVPIICATNCVIAPTFCGNLRGTATNATCFNGCTYACARADFRSGLTGCTGTVIMSATTCSAAVPLVLCTGANMVGRSACCGLTFVPTTGVLTATTFCGALSGTATNATCFAGCTYACACANIRSGLTSCTGTVTSVNVSVNGTAGTAVTTSGTITLTGVKGAGTCISTGYCQSSFSADCDRPLVISTLNGAGTGEHGTSCVCKVTFNPATGVMKSSVCGITGCCAGYVCRLTSANGGTRYALLDLGTGYEAQKIDIVQYFNRSQIVTACNGSFFYNSNTYGDQCIYQPSSTTARCIWFKYRAYIAPRIISTYPVCVLCDTTTAPSGATWNAGITDSTQCVISNGNNVKLYPTFVSVYNTTSGSGCNTTMYTDNGGDIYYNPSTNAFTVCGCTYTQGVNINTAAGTDVAVMLTHGGSCTCCNIGMAISTGNINRGIFHCPNGTFGWLQYWNDSCEVHNCPIYGCLCGLAAFSSRIAINRCAESEGYYVPFITANTGTYGNISYEQSFQYDPDEQCLGVYTVCSHEVSSNYMRTGLLCACKRTACNCICQYGNTTANSAFLRQCDITACTTEIIVTFSCTTLQCNLFNAIVCNVNLCRASGASYTPAQGYFNLDGSTFIRWDSSESPRNIDFISNGGSVKWTIYANCTCATNKEGAIKIFGKKGSTTL